MILPSNAALVFSAVQQLIKLGHRIDTLMAQRTAVQSDLVLGMPKLQLADLAGQLALCRKTLRDTASLQPDPFGDDRGAFQQQIARGQPDAAFDGLFEKYFPDAATGLLVTPDAAYLAQLEQAFPRLDWEDPAVRLAAFAIAAGSDDRQVSYHARLALAVVDTLFEFGAEHTALIVHDEKLRGLVQVVLQRFAQPDWDGFEQWNPLLQAALKATLNAALDLGKKLPSENPWLAGLLDALTQARTAAAQPDDFLLGLLHGRGVPLFLTQGLLTASDTLDDAHSDAFRQIAADVLRAAVPLVQDPASPDFRQFFNDHWGDLLRAGLSACDRHGDLLLDKTSPLLGRALKAIVQQLAATPDSSYLSNDTLFRLAEASLAIVADNAAEITGLENKPWLRDLLAAAAQSAKQLTAKKLFTPAAAEALLLDAIAVLAKHPDLIVAQAGLPLTLVTAVFAAVAPLQRVDARLLGETAVRAALRALATDSSLAAGKFGPAITMIASRLAGLLGSGKITAAQAAGLASAAIDATARNPKIFAELQKDIGGLIVATVQQVLPNHSAAPWAGRMLVSLTSETLLAVARSGGPVATKQSPAQFQKLLTDVLGAGLKLAADELGQSVDLDGIPVIVAALVERALRGEITSLDPATPEFIAAFKSLAATCAARN